MREGGFFLESMQESWKILLSGLCFTMSTVYLFLVVFMRWRLFGWIGFCRRVPLMEMVMAVSTGGLNGPVLSAESTTSLWLGSFSFVLGMGDLIVLCMCDTKFCFLLYCLQGGHWPHWPSSTIKAFVRCHLVNY